MQFLIYKNVKWNFWTIIITKIKWLYTSKRKKDIEKPPHSSFHSDRTWQYIFYVDVLCTKPNKSSDLFKFKGYPLLWPLQFSTLYNYISCNYSWLKLAILFYKHVYLLWAFSFIFITLRYLKTNQPLFVSIMILNNWKKWIFVFAIRFEV